MNAAWGMLLVLAVLGGLFALLKQVERWFSPPAELMRKLMHVAMGLVVLTFPWLFDRAWPVVVLSAVATAMLLAVRFVPRLHDGIGTVLNRVHRTSLGEIYFTLSVGLLFWLSGGDAVLYCIPMLIMTLADAMAALIGLAYGKLRYVTTEGLKSAEGSIAFFGIAFLSVHVPLLLFTQTGRAETLLIALIIAILSMLLEAIAWRGLDNLLIPLGAFAFLKLYLDHSTGDLALRLVATVMLLVFALSWRRRSSLDDSALMATALFGYGAWMLGGPLWLVGPGLVFVLHVLVWPRAGSRPTHTVFSVLAVIGAGLIWLTLYVRDPLGPYLVGYAVSFGVHLALFGVSYIDWHLPRGVQARRLGTCVLAGSALAFAQLIAWLMLPSTASLPAGVWLTGATVIGVSVGAIIFFSLRSRIYDGSGSDTHVHLAGFASGMAGSALAAALAAISS
jgi:phytol kinase